MRKAAWLLGIMAIAWPIANPAFSADQAVPRLPASAAVAPPTAPLPEVDFFTPRPVPAWQADFAARYWYGSAKTSKSLYDVPALSSAMVSRLTYSDMASSAGEFFGRVAFTNGWFVKGYAGAGALAKGNLQDEDFPPGIDPYSSTNSDQHGGFLSYASADVGYNVLRGGDFRVGAFVGYHYFNEGMNAFGCSQTATNPDVCQPPIPTSYQVISQNNTWQSLRLGLDGSVMLGDRFKLSGEGVWLPYVYLSGTDAHLLRIGSDVGDFTGPVPEDGNGQGYQFEALLSYLVTPWAGVGIGARYWHMQTNGNTHFEDHVVGEQAFSQPVDWKTDIYGVFVQASVKFGPYPISMN